MTAFVIVSFKVNNVKKKKKRKKKKDKKQTIAILFLNQ